MNATLTRPTRAELEAAYRAGQVSRAEVIPALIYHGMNRHMARWLTYEWDRPVLTEQQQLAAIVYNELHDLMDDAANRMPPTAGHMDTDRLAALRDDLSRALACTYRLEDAIAQMERCVGVER